MVFLLLILQLFSFNPNKEIVVDYAKCETNQLYIIDQEEKISIRLFNVSLNEEGLTYSCQRINDAKVVSYVVDPTTNHQVSPLQVWMILDGELLQKALIERGYAEVLVDNPTYLYQKELDEAREAKEAFAQNYSSRKMIDYNQIRGKNFVFFIFFLWLSFSLFSLFIIKKHLK